MFSLFEPTTNLNDVSAKNAKYNLIPISAAERGYMMGVDVVKTPVAINRNVQSVIRHDARTDKYRFLESPLPGLLIREIAYQDMTESEKALIGVGGRS